MKSTATEPFEALPMPRKDIPQPASGSYKVYKNAKEFVVVEAGSALEALQVSGVPLAYKIERESIDSIRVLGFTDWAQEPKPEVAKEAAPAAATTDTSQKETVLIPSQETAAAPPTAEALSNDDVNKLLNS